MPCLKDLYITATPDLPYPPTQLRKWVEANGGRWLPTVNKNTTHLICSKDAWKRAKHAPTSDASAKNDLVGKAKEVEGCYIVSYDWLEDCLHKKRRLSEKRYAWGRREKVRRRERRMGRVEGVWDRKKFEKGCQHAVEDVGSGEKKSSKSSSKPLPFFRSSLEELRERREARARVEEEARKEGEGGVVDGAATSEMKDGRGEDVKGRQENTKSEEVQMRDVDEEVSSAEEKNNEDGRDMTEEPDTSAEMEELRGKAVEGDDLEHVERQQNFSSASPSAPHLLSPPSSQPLNALRSQSGSAPPLTSQTPQIPSQLPHSPPTPSPASPAPRAERLTDNYHIYLDTTGFEYKINLFRINMPRNAIGRYSLRLFESHTKPHVYCTFIQYIPAPEKPAAEAEGNRKAANGVPILVGGWKDPKTEQGKSWGKAGTGRATAKGKGKNTNGIKTSAKPNNNNNSIDSKLLTILGPTSSTTKPPATAPPKPTYKSLLAPLNSDFPTAFDAFISAFYELTFLPWHLRLHPSAREIQKCNAGTAKLEPFLYKPPEPGLPAGLVPELPLAMEPFESEGVRRFRLPGMEVRLSGEYSLGAEILREENARLEAVRREEERRREKEKERVRREKEAKGKVRRERVRPFFGGVYKDEYL